ncbi:MAG: hypothetical protein ACHQRJ_25710, partial [Alphaproteobacteria bacterium]
MQQKTALIFATLFLLTASALPVAACDLDTTSTTRWTIAKQGGAGFLVTPCGEKFFSLGVNVIDGGNSGAQLGRPHYDWHAASESLEDWIGTTRQRLAQWGFNSAGGWSLPPQDLKLPSVINLELGRNARFHWFDPFDPATDARVAEQARLLTAPYRNTPYRIGYFSDNEVGWWGGALFLFYAQKPASNFTKQHWVAMLRAAYHEDWRRFTRDFVPPDDVHSWDAL